MQLIQDPLRRIRPTNVPANVAAEHGTDSRCKRNRDHARRLADHQRPRSDNVGNPSWVPPKTPQNSKT